MSADLPTGPADLHDLSRESAYERGMREGSMQARLDAHDHHLTAINGSMERVASALQVVNLNIVQLRDEAKTRDAVAVATAAALKEDTERKAAAVAAQLAEADKRWSPWGRVAIGFGLLLTVLNIAQVFIH